MDVIVHSGCELMVSMFNGKPGDNLPTLVFAKKVSVAKQTPK